MGLVVSWSDSCVCLYGFVVWIRWKFKFTRLFLIVAVVLFWRMQNGWWNIDTRDDGGFVFFGERERVSGEKERKSDWCLVVLHCI
jgi:hypothetical protein